MSMECFWMALAAFSSAFKKLLFSKPSTVMILFTDSIGSTGKISQKSSLYDFKKPSFPSLIDSFPLNKTLKVETVEWYFLFKVLFFWVEQPRNNITIANDVTFFKLMLH